MRTVQIIIILCISLPFLLMGADFKEEKIDLKKDMFFKTVAEADAIFIGRYLQGGSTKARVAVVKNIAGSLSGEIIVTEIDNEKIRRKYRIAPFQAGANYLFFVTKKNTDFAAAPEGVSLSIVGDKANFSFNTPFHSNFWQPFSQELLENALLAIREKAAGNLPAEREEKIQELFKKYITQKDINSAKELLAVAQRLSLRLDEDLYATLIKQNDALGCLAVKFSADIMGEIFFKKNILGKIKELGPESQIVAARAAIGAEAKEAVSILASLLQNVQLFSPVTSECFPSDNPDPNKKVFVRAIIELDTPDTLKILKKELDTEDAAWLGTMLRVMSEYEGEDLVTLVLEASLTERSSERRLEFAGYFDRIKSKEAAAILMSLFEKNENLFWKKIILTTLGKYGYAESLPFLVKILKDAPNEEVRSTAAISIGSLDSKDGSQALYEFIRREKSMLAKSIGIDAIAQIADKSVQDFLKKIITEEESPKIREQAANAIEDNLFILRYGKKKQ